MRNPEKTTCPCCGESIDMHRGHIPCSSKEPISEDNRYYWVSFADEDRFCGAAVVHCTDGDPISETWRLGINPGKDEDCSVVFQPLSPTDLPYFKAYLGRLLTDQARVLELARRFR